jgi:hypothetical protein
LLPDVEEGRIKLPNLLLDKGPLLPPLLIAVGQPRPKEDTTQARNGRDYRQGDYRKNPHRHATPEASNGSPAQSTVIAFTN